MSVLGRENVSTIKRHKQIAQEAVIRAFYRVEQQALLSSYLNKIIELEWENEILLAVKRNTNRKRTIQKTLMQINWQTINDTGT